MNRMAALMMMPALMGYPLAVKSVAAGAGIANAKVMRHIAAAKSAAGSEYDILVRGLCPAHPGQGAYPNISVDPKVRATWYKPPARVFDNLFYVGQSNVSAWAIKTSGGIILIDALFDYSVQPEIVDGLRTLGLDPAEIKYVVVSHGHRDHFGGAAALQAQGARILMARADWDLVDKMDGDKPRRDVVVDNRQNLTLGDTTIDIFPTPGHTPGTLSFIFPVTDHGRRAVAGLWGGTGFNSRTLEQFISYAASAKMFMAAAQKAGVTVPLSNHPVVDHTFAKIDNLKDHQRTGMPHPFVTGLQSQENLLKVGIECAGAWLAGRASTAKSVGSGKPRFLAAGSAMPTGLEARAR